MLSISDELRNVYPEAFLGLLAINNVCNPHQHEKLQGCKIELENNLREKYASLDKYYLKNMEPVKAYVDYYKKFKKTYHVLLQLESIVFKNKSIPTVSLLVEAMFMAEMKNLLLTAGHDLDTVKLPVKIDVAKGTERYIQISGEEKQLIKNDMFVSDGQGVTSSIIYGPDKRTRIKPNTKNVLYVVYAPPGIEKSTVSKHFNDIRHYVSIVSPKGKVETLEVYAVKA